MNTNIFGDYFNFKIKTVYEYSILLTKIIGINKNKLWHSKKNIEESLKWIINDYFNSINKMANNNIIRLFINDKDISKYKIDKELFSSINYFIVNEKGFEIKAYEKEIILASSIIHIANMLDIETSPYKETKNNYRTVLINYIEKFNKIPYFNLIDDGKKRTVELLELMKEKVKNERRLFETLTSQVSFNKYLDISQENKYYLTQYNYSISDLKTIDDFAIKKVYEDEKINQEFTIVSKDLILITLMKLFSIRKMRKIFFLPIKASYLTSDRFIREIKNINKNILLNKYLKLLIDYNDIDSEIEKLLKYQNIDYYIYCNKVTNINEQIIGNNFIISSEFNNAFGDYVNNLINNGKKIIYEKFEGIVIDNDLLKESEDY